MRSRPAARHGAVPSTAHAHLLLSADTMPALLRSTLLLFLKSTASWGRLLMTSHCRGGPKQGTRLCSEMSPAQRKMRVAGEQAQQVCSGGTLLALPAWA